MEEDDAAKGFVWCVAGPRVAHPGHLQLRAALDPLADAGTVRRDAPITAVLPRPETTHSRRHILSTGPPSVKLLATVASATELLVVQQTISIRAPFSNSPLELLSRRRRSN